MGEGKREAPQGERTPQGGEPAAKKSESLSRGKRVPKQKDWARAIDELRREEHVDLNLLLELKKMARSTFYYHMNNIGNALLFDDDERVYVFYGTGEQVELTSDLQ